MRSDEDSRSKVRRGLTLRSYFSPGETATNLSSRHAARHAHIAVDTVAVETPLLFMHWRLGSSGPSRVMRRQERGHVPSILQPACPLPTSANVACGAFMHVDMLAAHNGRQDRPRRARRTSAT